MAISQITSKSITDSTITSDDIATGAVESSMTTQIGGRRNLIINGAMQVAQRGTSSTGVTSNGYYTCDRFKNYISGLGTWSISQSTDAPDGFASSLKLDCTTADASPASSDYLQVGHFIEGQDLQQLQFGSSGAKSLTLSFWVKCNKTGTGRVHFAQPDASYRSIGGSYTISSANTWEQKTITIVGDTSGTINNDNGIGLEIIWWLDSGSNYNSGAMPTAWEADSAADRNAGGTLALGDSTDNEFYLTGVQLEVGTVATPFEHRSYGEELALCQRYYQLIAQTGGGGGNWLVGQGVGTTQFIGSAHLACPMRATPDANDPSQWNIIDADTYDAYSSGDVGAGVPAVQYKLNNNHVEISFTGMNSGTVTDNRPAFIYMYNKLELDAEL